MSRKNEERHCGMYCDRFTNSIADCVQINAENLVLIVYRSGGYM